MEINPSRQEVSIIHIAAIVLGSWHVYRTWDEFTENAVAVWNRFTIWDLEGNAQPAQPG